MVRIEQEQDIEVLRQVALKLQREVDLLMERIKELTRELSRLKGAEAAKAQTELDLLKELLARRERALFGDSSEKRTSPVEKASSPAPAPRRGHGPRPQPELPVIEQVHELPETERDCPVCGGKLAEMGDQCEESEEISVVERRFVVVKQKRKKYRCRCNASVVTAPGPPKLQSGGRYSPEFAVEVATSKYLDHLPLERQARIMRREGLRIDSQTLWDQTNVLAHHLKPSYEALSQRVMGSEVVGADETYWRLLSSKARKRWWVWGLASEDAVVYKILDSRSEESAGKLLAGYRGIVMADGYGVYSALSRDGPSFKLVHCWAHVRRKYVEIEEHYPKESGEMQDLIGELYKIERRANDAVEENRLRVRTELRDDQSRKIVKQIEDWAGEQRPLPRSGLGKAISYMLGLWPGLTAFLEDPRIPLDNNGIERGLRGVVVGRKNHYGSRSRRGTEVAAILYTLFESAKLCGVGPKEYLLKATHAAIAEPGTVTLPHELQN
jgi:transposase